MLDSMLKAGVTPDKVTFNTLIRGSCNLKKMGEAMKILHKMRDAGVNPNFQSYGTLIDAWSRVARRPDKAEEVLEMLIADSHARAGTREYNAAMLGYGYARNKRKVEHWYRRLIASGREPDNYTVKSLRLAGLISLAEEAESKMSCSGGGGRSGGSQRSRRGGARGRGRDGDRRSSRGRSSSSGRPTSRGRGRGICRAFQNTGHCRFGDRCRYSHSCG